MAVSGLKLGPGWRTMRAMLRPARFSAALNTNLRQANALIGAKVAGIAKKRISSGSGGYAKNRPLTAWIKGSARPLADNGDLLGRIRYEVIGPWSVEVGVMRWSKMANVAAILHEGAKIRVTSKMRAMFFALWLKSIGAGVVLRGRAKELWGQRPESGWRPLAASTSQIFIPPRPFMDFVLTDPSVIQMAKLNWNQAIAASFRKV